MSSTFNYESCAEAAKAGDIEELKRMHENGCEWDLYTTAYAAKYGHLECLKYARKNGCEWNWKTPTFAAEGGHLACLKYAHENGCEWDLYTTAYAAKGGYLECLQYAHENGCPWGLLTPIYASWHVNLDCFKYCFQMWNSPQEFWSYRFDLTNIIKKINLDDPLWRMLFHLDLPDYPDLAIKVKNKQIEIVEAREQCMDNLYNKTDKLCKDVIQYCVYPFI